MDDSTEVVDAYLWRDLDGGTDASSASPPVAAPALGTLVEVWGRLKPPFRSAWGKALCVLPEFVFGLAYVLGVRLMLAPPRQGGERQCGGRVRGPQHGASALDARPPCVAAATAMTAAPRAFCVAPNAMRTQSAGSRRYHGGRFR